ncbi:hypothetical protein [Naasia sp. SYSU D00057]|uniref:hypothetical protein n=1 Tax=Naasia sp. SYSU D00057 TaxID=2817380 RepID=UPI001B3134C7|nr:hypothetical protein [Naasia sp. SYSU D00057]
MTLKTATAITLVAAGLFGAPALAAAVSLGALATSGGTAHLAADLVPAVLAWAALGLAGLAVMGGLRIAYRRQAMRVEPLRRYELADLADRRR